MNKIFLREISRLDWIIELGYRNVRFKRFIGTDNSQPVPVVLLKAATKALAGRAITSLGLPS